MRDLFDHQAEDVFGEI
jgi:hypothetical protein